MMLVPMIFYVSRRTVIFVLFCLIFICIGCFENRIQGTSAFLEVTPTQCTANKRNCFQASIPRNSENTFQKQALVELKRSQSWNPHYPIHSFGVAISQRMQMNDNEQDYTSLPSQTDLEVVEEVPPTRIRDVPLRIKSKALSLYTSVSKRIVFTKKILLNIGPSLLFLRRINRKSTTAIGSTTTLENPTLPDTKNTIVDDRTVMSATTVRTSPTSSSISTTINTAPKNSSPVLAPPTTIVTKKPSMEISPTIKETMKVIINKSRLETCHPDTNLNGKWSVIVTPELKKSYDLYLQAFQQPALFRAVALNVLSMTKDTLIQSKNGKELTIIGTNPRGVWERTLISSGYKADWDSVDSDTESVDLDSFEPKFTMMRNAGGAEVDAECWWEDNGRVHTSWVRNAKEGDFYSRRYIDEEGYYICESFFYHNEMSKLKYGVKEDYKDDEPVASMVWKFERDE